MMDVVFLIGGVFCALLCHWIISHTYDGYTLKESGELGYSGSKKYKKVWDKKVKLARWVYILIWLFCIVFAPVAVIAPIVLGIYISIRCTDGEIRFVYTNKFIEWLKKEV